MAAATDKSGAGAYNADVVPDCSAAGNTTVLATRGALCENCRTYCRCEGSNATDSEGRANGASRRPECGLSAEFDDIAGNADAASYARVYRASGKGASWGDCWATTIGTRDEARGRCQLVRSSARVQSEQARG